MSDDGNHTPDDDLQRQPVSMTAAQPRTSTVESESRSSLLQPHLYLHPTCSPFTTYSYNNILNLDEA